jgi:UPF0176 protein
MQELRVANFFRFIDLPDCCDLQTILQKVGQDLQIKGTILLANEGINASIAGTEEALTIFLSQLTQDERLYDLAVTFTPVDWIPFKRWKVKLKSEIVSLGRSEANPRHQTGRWVTPEQWHDLLDDPDVVLIDTRNDFEVQLGSFAGAINPKTRRFREFPQFVAQQLDPGQHSKVALFCTGGIRCEKASAYLLSQGFDEVYQLQGGILHYLQQMPPEVGRWQGTCFVFDDRVSLGLQLQPSGDQLCPRCGQPFLPVAESIPPVAFCPDCVSQARLSEGFSP